MKIFYMGCFLNIYRCQQRASTAEKSLLHMIVILLIKKKLKTTCKTN